MNIEDSIKVVILVFIYWYFTQSGDVREQELNQCHRFKGTVSLVTNAINSSPNFGSNIDIKMAKNEMMYGFRNACVEGKQDGYFTKHNNNVEFNIVSVKRPVKYAEVEYGEIAESLESSKVCYVVSIELFIAYISENHKIGESLENAFGKLCKIDKFRFTKP